MNREAFQSFFPVHEMVGGNPSPIWWDLNNMGPPSDHQLHTFSSSSNSSTTPSSSSSSALPQYYSQSSTLQPMTSSWHDNQELPDSWSQLLLGGLVEELEDRCSYTLQAKRSMESCWEEDQLEIHKGNMIHELEIQAAAARSSWSRSSTTQILPISSPRSCVTNSCNSMLDFSNNKRHHQLDLSSECNSTPTGSPYKKARVQAQSTNFKVRKEKLGDRITALHQIVSPFGKTDTASVLLETIGYIRFLQSQIEALSSPYLGSSTTGSGGNIKHSADIVNEPKKDLKSRGLCLVPVSFMMHVGNDNAADYWAPTFGGGFR